jgi:hypothetical protein
MSSQFGTNPPIRDVRAHRSLSGDMRTTYAHCEFFALGPTADLSTDCRISVLKGSVRLVANFSYAFKFSLSAEC